MSEKSESDIWRSLEWGLGIGEGRSAQCEDSKIIYNALKVIVFFSYHIHVAGGE